MKSSSVTIQIKATEQYFPVVLFIMLYKVVLTFVSVNEILKCDHSNKSYCAVLFGGTVCFPIFCNLKFPICGFELGLNLFIVPQHPVSPYSS